MQQAVAFDKTCPGSEAEGTGHLPERMLFQWHVTERCNLRCSHCYQTEEIPPDPSWENLMQMLDQFRAFAAHLRRRQRQKSFRAHITITGGEPLMRPDALGLLERVADDEAGFSVALLTNGTLLTPGLAAHIGRLKPGFVQVSIDGRRETHDRIRGAGSYDAAVDGIRMLLRNRVQTHISFTASRRNFRDFTHVAELGRRLGVGRVWSDRMVPCGRASTGDDGAMTPEEVRQYVELMKRESGRGMRLKSSPVSLLRALQFTATGERPYRCSAGDTLVTVLPSGDLCPCRRMPHVLGNILTDGLRDIYESSGFLKRLRSRQTPSRGCEGCFYSETCGGGARCISYAVYGDPFRADPGCWLASGSRGPLTVNQCSA